MSYQATKFVIGLSDLSPAQKAVAHVFAHHADTDGNNSYPAMARVARESGFRSKRGAQKIVRQLEKLGVITAATAKTGGRGRDKATVYRLNLAYVGDQKGEHQFTVTEDERVNDGSSFSGSPGVNSGTQKGEQGDRKGRPPVHTNSQEESENSDWTKNAPVNTGDGRDEKELDSTLGRIWEHYLTATNRIPAINDFSVAKKKKGMARLRECLKRTKGDQEHAEQLMVAAIDTIARSDFHMGRDPKTNGRRFCDWDKHIFNTYEQMETWWNRDCDYDRRRN